MESKSGRPFSTDWVCGTPLEQCARYQLKNELNEENGALIYHYTAPPNAEDGNDKKVPLEDDKETSVDEEEGPDGGWGWVVVFSCFVMWVIIGSAAANFGILFSGFLTGLATSSTVTASIQNLGLVLSALCCYLVDPLVEEFGWRNVSIAMGVMMAAGMSLSAFVTSAVDLFFTYSVLASIPVEIIMTVTHAIVPYYFRRRMTLACSLTSCGSSVSLIVMPILLTVLVDEYGFRGATLITGALSLNCCAASLVFHPIEWHWPTNSSPTKTVTQRTKVEGDNTCSRVLNSVKRMLKTAQTNLWLFRSVRAILINVILTTNTMAFSNFLYLVPFAMEAAGDSPEEAGLTISVSGISLLVTRIVYPILFIRFNMRHQIGVMSSSVIIGTSIIVFAWADGLYLKLAMMGLMGVGIGMFFTSYCLVVVEVLGLSLLTPMLSISGVFKGASVTIFGPFIGWIRDVTDSYSVSLSVLGGILYITAVLWFFMPLGRKFDLSQEEQKKKYQQLEEMEGKKKVEQKSNKKTEKLPLLKK